MNCGAGFELAIADPVPSTTAALSVIRNLDHLVQVKQRVTLPLPVQHHRAAIFIKTDFGCPALDEFVVPPYPLVTILGGEFTNISSSVVPSIVVCLVIRMGPTFWKATEEARLMLVNLLIFIIEM